MSSKVYKKLSGSIIFIILISLCFTISTLAIVFSILSVDGNFFATGRVEINLNDGNPLVGANDSIVFEPGMTEIREFFVESKSSGDIYYKLYFENVRGALADALEIKIYDGDRLLLQGKPGELTRAAVGAFDDIIKPFERRVLQIHFHLPKETENLTGLEYFGFDFAVDAVQVKNNPNKDFE